MAVLLSMMQGAPEREAVLMERDAAHVCLDESRAVGWLLVTSTCQVGAPEQTDGPPLYRFLSQRPPMRSWGSAIAGSGSGSGSNLM